MDKIWKSIVLLCIVLVGCTSLQFNPNPLPVETSIRIASLTPSCESGDPGSCYGIGEAYKKATHFDEALVYFKQGCQMWDSLKSSIYSDIENSPLAKSEACCLLAGYTSQILDDYHSMLTYDSFGCDNFKTSVREFACGGAETAASVVNANNHANSKTADGIVGLDTTAIQGTQQVEQTK